MPEALWPRTQEWYSTELESVVKAVIRWAMFDLLAIQNNKAEAKLTRKMEEFMMARYDLDEFVQSFTSCNQQARQRQELD
jgi:hypothetical protein